MQLYNDLKKKGLIYLAGVSSYTISKLNRGDNVTTDVLQKIYTALEYDLPDIIELVPDARKGEHD